MRNPVHPQRRTLRSIVPAQQATTERDATNWREGQNSDLPKPKQSSSGYSVPRWGMALGTIVLTMDSSSAS
jgi:hypothetical protein